MRKIVSPLDGFGSPFGKKVGVTLPSFLLLESGSELLLESGGYIRLEN